MKTAITALGMMLGIALFGCDDPAEDTAYQEEGLTVPETMANDSGSEMPPIEDDLGPTQPFDQPYRAAKPPIDNSPSTTVTPDRDANSPAESGVSESPDTAETPDATDSGATTSDQQNTDQQNAPETDSAAPEKSAEETADSPVVKEVE